MRNNYSVDIANAIRRFLVEDDWKFSFSDDSGLFQFALGLNGKIKRISYTIRVHEDSYTVYAVSSMSADANDPRMMAEMAEFICRANYGLRNGNFELDMSDGEIRYKTFVDCENNLQSQAVVKDSIYCHASMFERYGGGIMDVIFGRVTAKEAIYMCENSSD